MSRIDEIVTAGSTGTDADERFMLAAISYGRRALGTTAPNPSVGALVVRDGIIIGRGLTSAGGRPHAETKALLDAGEQARGATLYVSLEPCSHTGLTPPCARAIINAGIARVVTGAGDPDPRVGGRGHQMMRDAGIEVVTNVAEAAANRANCGHILRVTKGRPLVTLKMAETADGYAAGDTHDGRLMITGIASNNRVQMMRAAHDAIMIGAGTARADDPLLTVRVRGAEQRKPLRVVLDAMASLELTSRLVSTCQTHPLLVFCGPEAPEKRIQALRAAGADVAQCEASSFGHIDIAKALGELAKRGITRVFSEGGPRVGSQLIRSGLADEVVLFTSAQPINRHGVVALEADARARLDTCDGYDLADDGRAGADRMRIWRRRC
jgi:diaminohydroxyphosphoribosylaminopyrimidine deaminase / 5-amino-6-(5-phosphoribosylamino)uracil reductase